MSQRTYTLNFWDNKDGYFKDGIYYRPIYCIHHNGEPIHIHGVIHGDDYCGAYLTMKHLQAVSSDSFTLEVYTWQAMTGFTIVTDDDPFAPVNRQGGEHE